MNLVAVSPSSSLEVIEFIVSRSVALNLMLPLWSLAAFFISEISLSLFFQPVVVEGHRSSFLKNIGGKALYDSFRIVNLAEGCWAL